MHNYSFTWSGLAFCGLISVFMLSGCGGGEELAAVTKRQPHLFQVRVGQLGCDDQVDVVAGEDMAVLFEAESLEQRIDIRHSGSLRGASTKPSGKGA